MADRRNLLRKSSDQPSSWKWFGFVIAIAVGVFIGWRLFLSPKPFPPPSPESTLTGQRTSLAPTPGIPIQATGVASNQLGQAVRVGSAAPVFTLPDLQGVPQSLSLYRGNVVLINFGTTWCPPCLAEMPALQQAFKKFQDQGFMVLAINLTELDDPKQVGPYARELGLSFPILLDENSEVSEDLYNIIGLPTSIFVGRDGTVRDIFIGALQLETLEAKIQSLLDELI